MPFYPFGIVAILLLLSPLVFAMLCIPDGDPANEHDSMVRPDDFGFRGAGCGSASGDAFESDYPTGAEKE